MKQLKMNRHILALVAVLVLGVIFQSHNAPGNRHSTSDLGDAFSSPSVTEALPNLQGDKAIKQLKQSGEYDSLAAALTAARYRVEEHEGELVANNPANQMRASFDATGVQLQSAKGEKWRTKWRLQSLGYGTNQKQTANGTLQSNENRTELRRDELGLIEWYKNTPAGLEHGFEVESKPDAETNSEPLRLVLKTEGDLIAQADADGNGLTMSDKRGATLRYENLKVWDANKQGLTARMRTAQIGRASCRERV